MHSIAPTLDLLNFSPADDAAEQRQRRADVLRATEGRTAGRGDITVARQEGTSVYLGGARRPLLTRDEEVELARCVEEGERAMVRAFVGLPVALRELAAIGKELEAQQIRIRDVLRAIEAEAEADVDGPADVPADAHAQAEGGPTSDARPAPADDLRDAPALGAAIAGDPLDEEQEGARLLALLERAAALASALDAPGAAEERDAISEELERARLHPRVLDRIVRALRASAAPDDRATRAALATIEEGRRRADEAKTRLVESNLRLVMAFARRHLNQGLQLQDLIQEGNIGLMRAVDKFDHRRGLRLSTYAAWWIKQQIARAIADQARTIRLPVHLVETRQKVRRVRRAFAQEHGREPTEEEIAATSGLARDKVRAVEELTQEPVSLQAPIGEGREAEVGDFTPDRTTPPPDEEIARARMREQTMALLETLTPRERDILRRRFGLDDTPEHTLAEIGESLSLSRERIRQIEATALHKLRVSSRSKELDSYLAT